MLAGYSAGKGEQLCDPQGGSEDRNPAVCLGWVVDARALV